MTTQHRKHRGYATQRLVADWFRGKLWPYAEPVGRDGVTGTPSWTIVVVDTRSSDA